MGFPVAAKARLGASHSAKLEFPKTGSSFYYSKQAAMMRGAVLMPRAQMPILGAPIEVERG
jgi:hypothetical protein